MFLISAEVWNVHVNPRQKIKKGENKFQREIKVCNA